MCSVFTNGLSQLKGMPDEVKEANQIETSADGFLSPLCHLMPMSLQYFLCFSMFILCAPFRNDILLPNVLSQPLTFHFSYSEPHPSSQRQATAKETFFTSRFFIMSLLLYLFKLLCVNSTYSFSHVYPTCQACLSVVHSYKKQTLCF